MRLPAARHGPRRADALGGLLPQAALEHLCQRFRLKQPCLPRFAGEAVWQLEREFQLGHWGSVVDFGFGDELCGFTASRWRIVISPVFWFRLTFADREMSITEQNSVAKSLGTKQRVHYMIRFGWEV